MKEAEAEPAQTVQTQEPVKQIVLEFDGSRGSLEQAYVLPQNGNTYIPRTLKLVAGSSGYKKLTVTYGQHILDQGIYWAKCRYFAYNTEDFVVEKCIDVNSRDYGDEIFENRFIFSKDELIRLQYAGPAPQEVIIKSVLSVDWK